MVSAIDLMFGIYAWPMRVPHGFLIPKDDGFRKNFASRVTWGGRRGFEQIIIIDYRAAAFTDHKVLEQGSGHFSRMSNVSAQPRRTLCAVGVERLVRAVFLDLT